MKTPNVSKLLNVPNLPLYIQKVEQALQATLTDASPSMRAPLKRVIHARSKRLRPTLLIITAASQGAKIDISVINCAAALEFVHIGSLVHDDIMDDALQRWGVATVNSKEGVNTAILIGDYLFAKAYQYAASVSQSAASIIASSLSAICDGQSSEMAEQYNINRSPSDLFNAHLGKTASLFTVACELGALCAGINQEEVETLRTYGQNLGLSFQLVDDLLDLLSSIDLLGKPVGNDVREGIYSLPILLSLRGPSASQVKKLLKLNDNIDMRALVELLNHDGSIKATVRQIQNYNQRAVGVLSKFEATEGMQILKKLPNLFLRQAVTEYVNKSYRDTILTYVDPV